MKSISKKPKRLKKIAKKAWYLGAKVESETLISEEKVHQIGVVYATYRFLIGVFLIFTNYTANETIKITNQLGNNILSSNIEYITLGLYILFAFGSMLTLILWRQYIYKQILTGLLIEVIFLTLLLYSGTTKDLQIILLYMVATAASFMMLKLKHATSVALIAILSLVFQQIYYSYANINSFLTIADTIMLSFSLFSVGFLSWSISQRLVAAEVKALENAKEIESLNAINKEVIKNMVNGVLVINKKNRLLVSNQTAKELLRLSEPGYLINDMAYIFEIERQLGQKYEKMIHWYQDDSQTSIFNLTLPPEKELPATTIRIHKKILSGYGKLLILEDISREESHAQQLKLASLGQLSASIAHEIRNPLAAISQASELLMEDDKCNDSGNLQLCQMIYQQCQRVNRIIEDVMRLSRQEPPKQQTLTPKRWFVQFLNQHYANENIKTHIDFDGSILFDPQHFEQIFINLINNALRHAQRLNEFAIEIIIHQNKERLFIDVLDDGLGVKNEDIANLFNPFFTKSVGGTGLGLYLSKAFSEANHAHLIYVPEQRKTCFRLIVPLDNT